MAFKIEGKLNSAQLKAWLDKTSQKTLRKVVAQSLNRTAITVRKEASQKIRQQVRLKAGEIKAALPIKKKAKATESIGSQETTIHASTKGLSLSKFSPRQTKEGVSVNITGRRQVIKHAFIARMPNASSSSVFRRERIRKPGTAPRRSKKGAELPIEKQAHVGVDKILEKVQGQLKETAAETFSKNFASNNHKQL